MTLPELAYLQPDDRATVVVDINQRRHNRDQVFAAVQLCRREVKVGFIKPGFRKELDRGHGANRVGFGPLEVCPERHHSSHDDCLRESAPSIVTSAPMQRPNAATSSVGANDVNRLGFGIAMARTYGIRVVSRGRSGFKVVADGSPRVMSCHGAI